MKLPAHLTKDTGAFSANKGGSTVSTELAVYEVPKPMSVADMRGQVALIQEVMASVMKKDEHYGTIPGTNKPSLLKAGAEKLIMTFRLVPDVEEQTIEFDNGHRECRVKVKLYTQNGIYLGSGVGSCSTMEGKYRFRTGPTELTANAVPKEYWDARKTNPAEAQKLLGGPGHVAKKNDHGEWVIAIQGDKVEHDNPADYYNTVLKMAKKRALVDACLTVTAASDIFTQDVEDMTEVIPGAAKAADENGSSKPPIATPQSKSGSGEKPKEPSADCEKVTALVEMVEVSTGKSAKGDWTKYAVCANGEKYSTFSETLGTFAQTLEGQEAILSFKKNGKFFNLEGIEPVMTAADGEPVPTE